MHDFCNHHLWEVKQSFSRNLPKTPAGDKLTKNQTHHFQTEFHRDKKHATTIERNKTVEDMGICQKTPKQFRFMPCDHTSTTLNPKYQVPSTDIPNYSVQFMGDPYQTSACEPQLRRCISFWSCLAAKRTPVYLRWDSGSFDGVTADCSLSCRPKKLSNFQVERLRSRPGRVRNSLLSPVAPLVSNCSQASGTPAATGAEERLRRQCEQVWLHGLRTYRQRWAIRNWLFRIPGELKPNLY